MGSKPPEIFENYITGMITNVITGVHHRRALFKVTLKGSVSP